MPVSALRLAALSALGGLMGCALGRVRHAEIAPLGPYGDVRAARVTVEGPPELAAPLESAVTKALQEEGHLHAAAPGEPAYRVALSVTSEEGDAPGPAPLRPLWRLESALGLSALAIGSGTLELAATVYAPDEDKALGQVEWRGAGAPAELAPAAGEETGNVLAQKMEARREDFVSRRAGDERLFLVPTPLTLAPGDFVFQDDEFLLTRAAVGLSRRFELDVWAGGAPIPVGGGAIGLLPHLVQAQGGAGLLFAGMFDAGLKFKLLDEGAVLPGVALSYDMLDVFGDAIGASGGISVGDGIVAQGGVGGGIANLQFNVFGIVAGKHFGDTQLIAGAYVVDNHHFLPQSAAFATGGGNLNETSSSINASSSGSAGTADLSMLPTQFVPYVAAEHVLGPHSTLMAELLPRAPWWDSVATTGVRWRLGFSRPVGPLALDRVRVTLDLAGVWAYYPTSSTRGIVAPMPYVSAGLYVL